MDFVRCAEPCEDLWTGTLSHKAYLFAKEKHKDQTRKFNGEPYFNHCVRVSDNVRKHSSGKREQIQVAAALLHDSLEDTSTTYDELVQEFGKEVADIVLALTNDKKELEALGKTKYLVQKVNTLSEEALFIKLCDRYDNTSDLRGIEDEWSRNYARQTIEVFRLGEPILGLSSRCAYLRMELRDRVQDYVL